MPTGTVHLACLAEGDSEQQVALRLGISAHTVHEHVKRLHRRFGVSSRGELLAHWFRQAPERRKR
jgi:DNA-binding CsgD family transcriptional regulator